MARIPHGYEIIFSRVGLRRESRYVSEFLHHNGHWQGIVAVTPGGLARAALAARVLLSMACFATPIKEGGRVTSGP